MIRLRGSFIPALLALGLASVAGGCVDGSDSSFAGSESCRECHERFYELWAPSRHGTAMQPFTAEFGETLVQPLERPMEVAGYSYTVEIDGARGTFVASGAGEEQRHRILHALGGKNVFYFLTELERGRLQVLPLAYDVRAEEWFDAPTSMVRHFGDETDIPVDWRDPLLTFNTSCYSCHVSQLSTNYDLETDSYSTVWAEPGINCETCHGGGERHVEVAREAGDGDLEDVEIIQTGDFDTERTNSMCAPCHAKGQVFAADFEPGDLYFDYYGLVALEHPDFYPDGRDLGENYTYTGWLMSPCTQSGQLDCLHCHTSSGRYRFAEGEPNGACAPCHDDKVSDAPAHTHHPEGSPGNECVSCHMPMTEFARMERSDHSMLPPSPAASREFGSPNACNICHTDQTVDWADEWVRQWRARDYQAPVLERARLVAAARDGDWTRRAEMLRYVSSANQDPVYATSLIRLLAGCDCDEKWPVIAGALEDPSPLVRAAAANVLALHPSPMSIEALIEATSDEFRVVRIQAAYALSNYSPNLLQGRDRKGLPSALAEYEASFEVRRDDWAAHYNKGNYHLNTGDPRAAVESFEIAARLRPDAIAPLVNSSMAYAAMGDAGSAEASLRRALEIEPEDPVANLNLGLLLGEQGRVPDAKSALRRVLEVDSTSAVAAYNLAVLVAPDDLDEAISLSSMASRLSPDSPRYAFTHAFYLTEKGDARGAEAVLLDVIERHPAYPDAYSLLGEVYQREGREDEAAAVYRRAMEAEGMTEQDRYRFSIMLRALQQL
jgi:tetratricopeptide (TPR) repeat protein